MSMMNYDSMENYVMDMMAKSGMEVDAEAMPETLNQLIGLAGLGSEIMRHDQSNAILLYERVSITSRCFKGAFNVWD